MIRRANGIIHVDVVQDNHRVVSAELEHGALQRPAGTLRQHAGGLYAADEVDDPHVRTLEEDVGDLSSRTGRVTHDIDHTLREASLLGDFGQHQARRDRRKL
jgi:hypothetical protein